MSEQALYTSYLLACVAGAVLSVLISRRHVRPFHRWARRIEPSTPAPALLSRWRVAIDARPMIGHLVGTEYRTYGIGQYLRSITEELAKQDQATQYILWSSSFKGTTPAWYDEFVRSHHNFRAVHLKLPNRVVDQLALRQQLRFLNEVVGSVDVSYEANYFQIRPAGAYSICNVADLSFGSTRNKRSGRLQEEAAWLAARADKLTTVSNASKARILKEIPGLVDDDIEVIYGAADSLFTPSTARVGRADVVRKYNLPTRFFLYVGEATARKNAGLLIQAFQRVRLAHSDACLVFVGCSVDDIRQGLPGLDLTGIRAIDYVPRADMPSLYGAATALVYPSREEGFGLPVVEAMSTGQVVIISKDAALVEVAGDAAISVESTAEAIASSMLRVHEMNDSERTRLVDAGLQRVRLYSWATSAKRLLALFEAGMRMRIRAA